MPFGVKPRSVVKKTTKIPNRSVSYEEMKLWRDRADVLDKDLLMAQSELRDKEDAYTRQISAMRAQLQELSMLQQQMKNIGLLIRDKCAKEIEDGQHNNLTIEGVVAMYLERYRVCANEVQARRNWWKRSTLSRVIAAITGDGSVVMEEYK